MGENKMKNNNEKLYLGIDGKYYQRHELENAYFLVTGRKIWSEDKPMDNVKMFDVWVYDLMGISIKAIVNMNDVTYEEFLRANQKILAVRVYRDRNNCTLREAKEAIDKIQEEMEKK
jgi:hypothetical protein